ncbi:MAG: electron transport complex subunit RsxE [Planctomycetota bacterium]|jgi:electron transport complex protein RnfE
MATEAKPLTYEFIKGFISDNPILALMLGLCPALAVTTSAKYAVGMAGAATFVLLGSNFIVSLLRPVIPKKVRIPVFIVTIATFVTIVDLTMNAFFPPIHAALGIFIPLIVVNCVILGRAEAFASRNPVMNSVVDALGMGIGFGIILVVLASIREVLGSLSWFGIPLVDKETAKECRFLIMIFPPGAFLGLGLLMGLSNRIFRKG